MSDENFIEELQRKRQEALVRQIASRSFLDAKSSKNFACAAASCLPTIAMFRQSEILVRLISLP